MDSYLLNNYKSKRIKKYMIIICLMTFVLLAGCTDGSKVNSASEFSAKEQSINQFEDNKVSIDIKKVNERDENEDDVVKDNQTIVLEKTISVDGKQVLFNVIEGNEEQYNYRLDFNDDSGKRIIIENNCDKEEFVEENWVERIRFVDANFDGYIDILVWVGATGSKGNLRYDCYLKKEEEYIYCDSFSNILNPNINSDEQVVTSINTEVDTYSESKYVFCDDNYSLISIDKYIYDEEGRDYILVK